MLKQRIYSVTLGLIMLIVTLVSANLNWGPYWNGTIESDGRGYYAYLPAVFIYQDLNFSFFDSIEGVKYYDVNFYSDYRSPYNGRLINKYYCGTALAQMPFFLIAHASAVWLGYDADGYSKPYPVLVNIAALFYLFVGLVFINRSLKLYQVKEWQRAVTLFAATFGTHLFYYAVVEPGMSHIYSFAFVAMFFYCAQRYFASFRPKYIVLLGLLLGMITIIRPINGLVVFILPFAAGQFHVLKDGLIRAFRKPAGLIAATVLFIGVVFIQLITYKLATGNFLVYSYNSEGFDFSNPHIIDILFSYRKGLFLYTPLLLVSLLGLWFVGKRTPFAAWSWLAFFLLITYVMSSWWMWFYGASFSSRVYVEYIPLFMVLLGLSLNSVKRKLPLLITIGLLIVVCQIQTYQYRYYDIHWADTTKEKYWDVFLRIDRLIR